MFMAIRAPRFIAGLAVVCVSAVAATSSVRAQRVGPDVVRRIVMHEQTGQAAQAPAVSSEKALVNRYCVTCHNERRKTPEGAPLILDKIDVDRVADNPAVWEKVVRKVKSGAMPPTGMPRPQPAAFAG